jgi:hypothetical protein
LVEVTSTAAAGLVVALVLNAVTRRLRDSGTADDEVPAPAAGQTDA